MGVGYVIGPAIASIMFAGGVLSWLVLLPLLSILGEYINVPFPPIHPNYANNPRPACRFSSGNGGRPDVEPYIRYIGGRRPGGRLITLGRTLPTIIASAARAEGFGAASGARAPCEQSATSDDVVLVGSLLLAVFLGSLRRCRCREFPGGDSRHRLRFPVRHRCPHASRGSRYLVDPFPG